MKSIEDDPSMTPGSVVRSPLSIATIKDNELFNMTSNKSPPLGGDALPPLSIGSNTWTFNPTSTSTMISRYCFFLVELMSLMLNFFFFC